MASFHDDKSIMEHTAGSNTNIILLALHVEELSNVVGQDLSRKYFVIHAKPPPSLAKLALFLCIDGQRLTTRHSYHLVFLEESPRT
jgi:hypothetical protein